MTSYCCAMREKFLIGIVAENAEVKTPTDAADFIDFDLRRRDGKPVIKIRYCPFCGKDASGPLRVL